MRTSRRAIHPVLGIFAVAFFSVYTGLLLFYQPIHTWQVTLYVAGDVSVSIPTFFGHPWVIAIAYTIAASTLIVFLAVTTGSIP